MTRIAGSANQLGHGQVAELVGRIRWVNRRVYIDIGVLLNGAGEGVALDEHLAGQEVSWVPLATVEATPDATLRILRVVDRTGDDEPPPFMLDWMDLLHVDAVENEAVDVAELWGQSRVDADVAWRRRP